MHLPSTRTSTIPFHLFNYTSTISFCLFTYTLLSCERIGRPIPNPREEFRFFEIFTNMSKGSLIIIDRSFVAKICSTCGIVVRKQMIYHVGRIWWMSWWKVVSLLLSRIKFGRRCKRKSFSDKFRMAKDRLWFQHSSSLEKYKSTILGTSQWLVETYTRISFHGKNGRHPPISIYGPG